MIMKVCFLFNHDAAHHVAHSIGIAAALADHHSGVETVIAYGSDEIYQEIVSHLTQDQIGKLLWHDLSLGSLINSLLAPFNRILPARRLARLRKGAGYLRQFDLIVSPERTCLMLKKKWGEDGPKFVFVPHGAGDRAVTYHPAMKDFDLMLISGQKVQDQMVAHGILQPEQCRIIGYPKFDWLDAKEPEKFFDNDNPVFLYNPHFDPLLSSWYDEGEKILEWFFQRPDQYNLIFAPHVMLFFKELHISPEYKKSRRRPDITQKFEAVPNILIDVDSERLFDMSYTLSADAYIGDVSSQVYEFLYHARPCFFIDTHSREIGKLHSPDNPTYELWTLGPVASSAEELFPSFEKLMEIGSSFKAQQEKLMDYTADRSDPRPAAIRGAEALAEYLNMQKNDTQNG